MVLVSSLLTLLLLTPKPTVEVWATSADGSVTCMRGYESLRCPGPVVPLVFIKLTNLSEDFYCPEITVEIRNAYRAFAESDCLPWAEWKEENPTDQTVVQKLIHGRLGQGLWTIYIEVRQGKKVIRRTLEIQVGAGE